MLTASGDLPGAGMAVPSIPSGDFGRVASFFQRSRVASFETGRKEHIDISPSTPYSPGIKMPKAMMGTGDIILDPMQNLQFEGINLEGYSGREPANITGQGSDGSSLRSRGLSAYKQFQ
jgi:hypothetical protein